MSYTAEHFGPNYSSWHDTDTLDSNFFPFILFIYITLDFMQFQTMLQHL